MLTNDNVVVIIANITVIITTVVDVVVCVLEYCCYLKLGLARVSVY